jgi:uncharacterized membrane protein YpjA
METAARWWRRLTDDDGLPERDPLPRYVAPLPRWLENFGLHLAAPIALVNLVGTAFGFWYYGFHPWPTTDPLFTGQFALEPLALWPLVPDSPVATLFIALALLAWRRGRSNEYLNALAFFGCIKLGLWTPYVLLAFKADFSFLHPAMYNFLFWSHLAMVVEAFLLHRISDFPVRAVGLAVAWYGLNDLVDYFVPILGTPHHTLVPAEPIVEGVVRHVSPAHELAAAGAVTLTLAATFLALATRVRKLELGALAGDRTK